MAAGVEYGGIVGLIWASVASVPRSVFELNVRDGNGGSDEARRTSGKDDMILTVHGNDDLQETPLAPTRAREGLGGNVAVARDPTPIGVEDGHHVRTRSGNCAGGDRRAIRRSGHVPPGKNVAQSSV